MPTAIVTGGARGLGRVYSLALAGAGFDVVVADLLDSQETVDEITAGGGRAIGCRADVVSAADNEAVAAAAAGAFDTIDVLINNAAYYSQIVRTAFNEVSQEEWDRTFEVNVRGAWLACCAVYPYMRNQGSGKIINISSTTSFKGTVGFPHYVASKSAIIGLTRCLAAELGPDGITVNTVTPDLIPDPSLRPSDAVSDEFVVAGRAIKRTQAPDDMVGTILYLAGPGSDFVTGQNIVVNGGAFFQ
ncbi:MAG: SDR family oxidoreductase [Acidimicrobiaceae bacterium]|nr:SDR family oxidoreductase [Acidimicrobiaceae bacterium]